jgi:hypothetical protein
VTGVQTCALPIFSLFTQQEENRMSARIANTVNLFFVVILYFIR